jgi:hypothetical protein
MAQPLIEAWQGRVGAAHVLADQAANIARGISSIGSRGRRLTPGSHTRSGDALARTPHPFPRRPQVRRALSRPVSGAHRYLECPESLAQFSGHLSGGDHGLEERSVRCLTEAAGVSGRAVRVAAWRHSRMNSCASPECTSTTSCKPARGSPRRQWWPDRRK